MLKFQVRSSAGHSPVSSASSSPSSPSLSSIPSSSSSSTSSTNHQQRHSQISSSSSSASSQEAEEFGQRREAQNIRQRPFAAPSPPPAPLGPPPPISPSPSLPPPMSLLAPPIPPKPANLMIRLAPPSPPVIHRRSAKSCERSTAPLEEFAHLRVYTGQIKPDTDYKTLRLAQNATTAEVIRRVVEEKLRLTTLRDLNLFHLFMEIRSRQRRQDGTVGVAEVRSLLELDAQTRPLELQRCHPEGMSRFILGMDSNAILARIYVSDICPEVNYKSVFISRRTSCAQVLGMLHQMCRFGGQKGRRQQQLGIEAISELRLFTIQGNNGAAALIPANRCLAGVYLSLLPGQQIALRRVIVPRNGDGF